MLVKINEKDLNKLFDDLSKDITSATVRVGVAGTIRRKVAEWLEFGTDKMGARPFLRPVMHNKRTLTNAIQSAIKGWISGEGTVAENTKDLLVGFVRRYIEGFKAGDTWNGIVAQPLKQSTIDRKGSDKLLIDDNELMEAIAGEVVHSSRRK